MFVYVEMRRRKLMRSKAWSALCATLSIFFAPPVLAEVSGFECSGPGGPYYGNPDFGLYTAELISDNGNGVKIGVVDVFNTQDELKFIFKPNSDIDFTAIQLWTDTGITSIPIKKDGKPHFGKFPWVTKPNLVAGDEYTISLNLEFDLGFQWRGTSHKWWFLAHGNFLQGDYEGDFIAKGPCELDPYTKYTYHPKWIHRPDRGHFIDSPVVGLGYHGPTQKGITKAGKPDGGGGFLFFPGETIEFSLGDIVLGEGPAAKKVSPLDLFHGADINDPRVIDVARILQTLDADRTDGQITLLPQVVDTFNEVAQNYVEPDGTLAYGEDSLDIYGLLMDTVLASPELADDLGVVAAEEAQGNLEAGLNASGIFRKNVSKTEDWGETKQKLEVMPVYFPGMRSNGDPSLCV